MTPPLPSERHGRSGARSADATRAAFAFEMRKVFSGRPTIVATLATLVIVVSVSAGGYVTARAGGDTTIATKASSLLTAPGWPGFTGLASTAAGVAVVLAAGIVMAWSVGREFTDGTIVGLFALPPAPSTVAAAKTAAALGWCLVLALACGSAAALAGLLVGLPPRGAPGCLGVVTIVTVLLGAAASPTMWIATLGRGYLAGIAATLGIVVATNLLAGFDLGAWVPWAVPVLWAMPGSGLPAPLLVGPVAVALAGAGLTWLSWRCLQIGDD